ncbi:MAG: PIG-L family deacetylase, partial [Acidimicrobiales bacterium]
GANHYRDVTDQIDRKLEALACHASQITNPEAAANMVRQWLGASAAEGGLPPGRLAEAFRVISTA